MDSLSQRDLERFLAGPVDDARLADWKRRALTLLEDAHGEHAVGLELQRQALISEYHNLTAGEARS